MRKFLIIALCTTIGAVLFLIKQNKSLRVEADRQTSNVFALMGDVKRYKVRDSLNATQIDALRLNVRELKSCRAEDAKLIKELRLRPKDVEYITKTEIITRDSLVFVMRSDSCFHYRDEWLQIDACLPDSSIYIANRDSIVQIIHPVYKHRFLWLRWGLKGVRQEIINFNPRSKVEYSEIVKVGK